MLTRRLRKQIEWHFYNHKADIALYDEKVREIAEAGISTRYDRAGGRGTPNSDVVFYKALQIAALDKQLGWAAVVRNTFAAFRFEPEYDVMVDLYINHKSRKEIFETGLWESTFWRWRDKWLEHAYKWAKEFCLL